MTLSVWGVKVFSPKGNLLQIWPENPESLFNGSKEDFIKHVKETKCRLVLERHPELKVDDLQIEVSAGERP